MPTPRVVQAIVRQRTSLDIDRLEAVRLMSQAASVRPTAVVDVHGRDLRTRQIHTVRMTIAQLLQPPKEFVSPA